LNAHRTLADAKSAVKERVDFAEVVGRYAKLVKEAGGFKACCPLPGHKEKTPSFHIDTRQKLFYCYGCQRGGDVFTFLEQVEGLSFMEALKELAAGLGVELPPPPSRSGAPRVDYGGSEAREAAQVEKGRKEAGIGLLDRAAKYYSRVLLEEGAPGASEALFYLTQRGISEEEIASLGLGWAPPGSALAPKLDKAQLELAAAVGLVRNYEGRIYDFFQERLMIPIADHRGRVLAFSGRTLRPVDAKNPKYKNSPETDWFKKKAVVYGLDRAARLAREHGFIAVVEGYFDQWALLRAEVPAVAVMGTALTPEHVELLTRYTKQVVLVLDADSAGVAATMKSLPVLIEAGCEAKVFSDLKGKDPADWLLEVKLEPSEVRRRIRSSTEAAQWWVERVIADGNKEGLDRTQVFSRLAEPWSWIRREDHRRVLAETVAALLLKAGSDVATVARETMFDLDRLAREKVRTREPQQRAAPGPLAPTPPALAPRGLPQTRSERLAEEIFVFWLRHLSLLWPSADADWDELMSLWEKTPGELFITRLRTYGGTCPEKESLSEWIDDPELSSESKRWLLSALVGTAQGEERMDSGKMSESFNEMKRSLLQERYRYEMGRVQNELRSKSGDAEETERLLRELQALRLRLEKA
jgi:DNA primase catalytic core